MTESVTPNSKPASRPDKPPQTIGGGWIILRRDRKSRRFRMQGRQPYEHGSRLEAETQARVMAERFGDEFAVLQQISSVMPPLVKAGPTTAVLDPLAATAAEIEAPPPAEISPPRPAHQVEVKRRRTLSINAPNPKPSGSMCSLGSGTKPRSGQSRPPAPGER